MANLSASWDELNDVWPWKRVLTASEVITVERFTAAYPTTMLHASFLSAHGAKNVRWQEWLPPSANSNSDYTVLDPVYGVSFMIAFNLAWHLQLASNAALSAFGTRELRVSGWEATRE